MVNLLKWTNVSSTEVVQAKHRLEASVFNIEVRTAHDDIKKCRYNLLPLSECWLDCYYGGRAKRNYVASNSLDAIGFLGSSEMLTLFPKPEKFLSAITMSLDPFRVKEGTILISRSGTIGNLTMVNKTLSRFLVSEHAIRIIAKESPGYLYSYLSTKTGQALIKGNVYGAVVDQIEPEHLATIEIPNPPNEIKKSIHNKIINSFQHRDMSNELITEAETILIQELKLPTLEKMNPNYYNQEAEFINFSVASNFLENRFDGSYHIPIINSIIDCLLDNAEKILPLENNELTQRIILPGRFKRTYVEEGEGIVFLGGKQIYGLDPTNKKYLSLKMHRNRIATQLFLLENMIAITCSGTIGKVNIIPKHWENWTMSQHVLRVLPKDESMAGYLYVWLNSDYGRVLIERFTYGSVVDEIDDRHLSRVPIPIVKNKSRMKEINDLALKANKLRSEAYFLEQEAIKQVNEEVIFA